MTVSVAQEVAPEKKKEGRRRDDGTRSRKIVAGVSLTGKQCLLAVVVLVIFAFPLFYLAVESLKTTDAFLKSPLGLPTHPILSNYKEAWVQGSFSREMLNSLAYAIIPDAITLVLGVFLAFPISRNYFRHSNFLYAFFLFSGFLPGALIPLFVEARFLHVYDSFIGYLILLSLGGAGFFFFVGYIKGIPTEIDEAAAMDGCGYLRFIFQIVMPQMKPALATFAIFGFVAEWNSLILPIVMLPNQNLYPITRGLFGFYGEHTDAWPLVCAATLIVAGPIIILFVLLQRYLVEGVSGGASMGSRGLGTTGQATVAP